jgi:hypothetical protein
MVQHTEAIYQVELFILQREREDVSLEDVHLGMPPHVGERSLDGVAQVDADDRPAIFQHDLREPARATPHVQHDLVPEVRQREAHCGRKSVLRFPGAVRAVQLGPTMYIPLETKVAHIAVVSDKAWDVILDRSGTSATTCEASRLHFSVDFLGDSERQFRRTAIRAVQPSEQLTLHLHPTHNITNEASTLRSRANLTPPHASATRTCWKQATSSSFHGFNSFIKSPGVALGRDNGGLFPCSAVR